MKLSANRNSNFLPELEDHHHHENLSKFRRRNKIILLVFTTFFIFLILIICALIFHLVHTISSTSHSDYSITLIPAVRAFHSCNTTSCDSETSISNPSINNNTANNISTSDDPNQIFVLSLQTAAEQLQNITTSASLINSSSFKNCSYSLRHGSGRIRAVFTTMRVNPFVSTLSKEQRVEIMNRIALAEEDLKSCVDDLAEVESTAAIEEVRAEVLRVMVYLRSSGDFVVRYHKYLHEFHTDVAADYWRNMISDHMFVICMCGLQLLFIFFLYWSLFRFG